MRVGIVGSRRRKDYWNIWELVDALPYDTVIVSGGCKGPDKWATEHAKEKGKKIIEHLPDLHPHPLQFFYSSHNMLL